MGTKARPEAKRFEEATADYGLGRMALGFICCWMYVKCISICSLLTLYAGRLDESQYLLFKPRPKRKYSDVVKQPWPPNGEAGTQAELSALTQAPLMAPIPVAQLTDEMEMPAIAKRVRNASGKEWDCIIQRHALPGLAQGAADDVHNLYTPPKNVSRPPATPLRGQGSLSPSGASATPGWRKRAPPKQKQVFLPAESAQPMNGLAVPDSSSPRKVSAMRLPAGDEAATLAKPEAAPSKRTEKPEPPTFLGRINRTDSFAKPEPMHPPKYQVQKIEDPDSLASAIFAGKRVHPIGEANCAALRQELERAGASLINRTDADVDFYVVRLAGCVACAFSLLRMYFTNGCMQWRGTNEARSTRA